MDFHPVPPSAVHKSPRAPEEMGAVGGSQKRAKALASAPRPCAPLVGHSFTLGWKTMPAWGEEGGGPWSCLCIGRTGALFKSPMGRGPSLATLKHGSPGDEMTKKKKPIESPERRPLLWPLKR